MTNREKARLLLDYIAHCTGKIKAKPDDERNYGEIREALSRLRELTGLGGETGYRHLADEADEQYYGDVEGRMGE